MWASGERTFQGEQKTSQSRGVPAGWDRMHEGQSSQEVKCIHSDSGRRSGHSHKVIEKMVKQVFIKVSRIKRSKQKMVKAPGRSRTTKHDSLQ